MPKLNKTLLCTSLFALFANLGCKSLQELRGGRFGGIDQQGDRKASTLQWGKPMPVQVHQEASALQLTLDKNLLGKDKITKIHICRLVSFMSSQCTSEQIEYTSLPEFNLDWLAAGYYRISLSRCSDAQSVQGISCDATQAPFTFEQRPLPPASARLVAMERAMHTATKNQAQALYEAAWQYRNETQACTGRISELDNMTAFGDVANLGIVQFVDKFDAMLSPHQIRKGQGGEGLQLLDTTKKVTMVMWTHPPGSSLRERLVKMVEDKHVALIVGDFDGSNMTLGQDTRYYSGGTQNDWDFDKRKFRGDVEFISLPDIPDSDADAVYSAFKKTPAYWDVDAEFHAIDEMKALKVDLEGALTAKGLLPASYKPKDNMWGAGELIKVLERKPVADALQLAKAPGSAIEVIDLASKAASYKTLYDIRRGRIDAYNANPKSSHCGRVATNVLMDMYNKPGDLNYKHAFFSYLDTPSSLHRQVIEHGKRVDQGITAGGAKSSYKTPMLMFSGLLVLGAAVVYFSQDLKLANTCSPDLSLSYQKKLRFILENLANIQGVRLQNLYRS